MNENILLNSLKYDKNKTILKTLIDNKLSIDNDNNLIFKIKNINFIIDHKNNLYFYINNNKKILFTNSYNTIYELFKYLIKNNLNEIYNNGIEIYYSIETNIIYMNSNINLNETEIIYIYKTDKKEIKEYLVKSLKE